jgi:selT/selW/selH-like putative selenoprotein
VKGRDGVFEVTLDDALVFSKKKLGRFPEPGEVESALESELGSDSQSVS